MKLPQYHSEVNIPARAPSARGDLASVRVAYSGLDNLLTNVSRFAEVVDRDAERRAAQEAAHAEAETRTTWVSRFSDMKRDAGDGAPDFQASFLQAFDDDIEARVAKVSPRAQPLLRQRLATEKAGWAARAEAFEEVARADKAKRDLQGTLNEGANQVRIDPNQFAAARGTAIGAIRASGLDANTQAQMIADYDAQLASASYEGEIERNPENAHRMLAAGEFRRALKPNQWDSISDKVTARLEQKRNAEAAEVAALTNDHLLSIEQTGRGIPGLSDRAKALKPERYAEFAAAESRARQVHGALGGMELAAPDRLAATVERFKPVTGSTDYAVQAQTYQALQQRAAQILKARADDPAGFVAMRDPDVKAAAEAARTDPALLPVFVDKSLAAQASLGIPESDRRSLPAAHAKQIVQDIVAADPERGLDTLQGLAAQYGKHWPRVAREMIAEKLPDEMILAATLTAPQDAVASVKFMQAVKVGKAKLEQAVAGPDKTAIAEGLRSELAEWRETEAARAGATRNIAIMHEGATLYALAEVNAGRSASEAARTAAKALVLDRVDIVNSAGFKIAAPKGTGELVQATGNSIREALTAEQLATPAARRNETLTDQQRREVYLKAARRGTWVLDDTGEGAVLLDEITQPVRLASGELVRFRFADMDPKIVSARPAPAMVMP